MQRAVSFVSVLAVFGGLVGCATTQATQGDQGPERVQMDPIVVHTEKDPLTGLEGYDAEQLMELGRQQMAAEAWDRAISVFDKLIAEFPDSGYVVPALYNTGLCYEHLAEWAQATDRYQRIIDGYPGTESFRDAHFRKALMLGKQERWEDVANTFWAIRQLEGLTTMDELEARVGQGVGMFMQGDFATAEAEFRGALTFYEDKKKTEFLPAEYWVGQSRFYLGEIYAREMEAIKLSAPSGPEADWVEMMGKDLEKKCDLLLRAQNNFIRTIRVGHHGWATAAGFRIGSLYERLYDDLIKVPVPPELSEEQQGVYREELKKRVEVLVTKAIKVYEMSLEMAERIGQKNEWVDKTSKSLERMKQLYLARLD
ncbi:MAG: tetratricopeptide repeat protein [Myxococcales bacterium]|nr:tetratricopeptide repeat protein [Myxococcales bacterium]MCB9645423.1 tetratricopeptide repeat protein [Deltaproteobacteria bacterium]